MIIALRECWQLYKPSEWLGYGLVFVLFAASVWGSRQSRLHNESAIEARDLSLILTETTDMAVVAERLMARGVDLNREELLWASRIFGWRRAQRGHYRISTDSYSAFLEKLGRGIQDPVHVVVLPGIDVDTFSESVAAHFHFGSNALKSVFSDSAFARTQGVSLNELFGRMLPETYQMYWTASPEDVVQRMLSTFRKSVEMEWATPLNASEYSLHQILTMASIVEWEARLDEERPRIAGLYWNRLKRGWRLQADPTVSFALGERRRLLFEDYKVDHPYNTYLRRGLPPGPITNPSLKTIKATLNPEDHDFMYMVASIEQVGGHVFTRSLADHNAASERWRRWLRKQYRLKRERENS